MGDGPFDHDDKPFVFPIISSRWWLIGPEIPQQFDHLHSQLEVVFLWSVDWNAATAKVDFASNASGEPMTGSP